MDQSKLSMRTKPHKRLFRTLLSLITALAMVITMMPAGTIRVQAAIGDVVSSGTCGADGDGSNITWELKENDTQLNPNVTLYLTGTGAMKDFSSNGYYSTAGWSRWCTRITAVVISSGITNIGDYAFYSDDGFMFSEIAIPDSVKTIGERAFYNCKNLSSITWGSGLEKIKTCAFSSCGFSAITIPESVNEIGESAFSANSSLNSIDIGKNTSAIEWGEAIKDCEALTSISVDQANTAYTAEDGVLFSKDKTKLFKYPAGKTETTYEIPATVTEIGDNAFRDHQNLTSVKIPGNVKKIGELAFGFNELKPEICDGVEEIGGGPSFTFYIPETDSFTLPKSIKKIGKQAFYVMGKGKIFLLAENVTFESFPFRNYFSGTLYTPVSNDTANLINGASYDIVFICTAPDPAQTAYEYTGSPITHIELPTANCGYTVATGSSITATEAGNYTATVSLKADIANGSHTVSYVWGDVNDPSTWATTDDTADKTYAWSITAPLPTSGTAGGCTWALSDDEKTLTISKAEDGDGILPNYQSPWGRQDKITKVVINEGVKGIGDRSFANHKVLESVSLPESLEKIGEMAFYVCSALKSVIIPKAVTKICFLAFSECKALEAVVISEGVEIIGDNAFNGCTALKEISIPGSVKTIAGTGFVNCSSLEKVEIAEGIESIGGGSFDHCPKLISVTIGVKEKVDFGNSVFFTANKSTANFENIIFKVSPKGVSKFTTTAGELKSTATPGVYTMPVISEEFTVKCEDVAATVELEKTQYDRTGSEIKPSVTVKVGETALKEDDDYTVTYSNNINAGTATATVSFMGMYCGTVSKEFTINPDADVDAAIAAITDIGTVELTDACKEKINSARAAYNALTDTQKKIVDNYATLTAAETKYAELKAAAEQAAKEAAEKAQAEKEAADKTAAGNVTGKITAIGTVEYTDASKAKIDAARAAYNALTDDQKKLVTNYTTLTDAETKYSELKAAAEAASAGTDEPAPTGSESTTPTGTETTTPTGTESTTPTGTETTTPTGTENSSSTGSESATPTVTGTPAPTEETNAGSTTKTETTKNADGTTTVKEETVNKDGSTVVKEETTDTKGNTVISEEKTDADGTVTAREETRNADGTGSATSTTTDADGNVLSKTEEKTTVNKKGTVTVATTTANADGSTVESTVKTTTAGKVVTETVETAADGSSVTTNETSTTDAEGNISKKSTTVEKDADGNTESTTETTSIIAEDENGNVSITSEIVEKDASGNVLSTTEETVSIDEKGKMTVAAEITNADGSKVEETFTVSTKGNVKMTSVDTTQKSVEIPESTIVNGEEYPVTTIGKGSLSGNTKLTSVKLGENITTIGRRAFKGDKKLKNIELTDAVTKISKDAFKGIAKNAVFKITAATEDEFERVKALIIASGAKNVKFERVIPEN